MPNHWNDGGDLVIEDRTLFRQVGWQSHNARTFSSMEDGPVHGEREGYSPVYVQIATDHGDGWED